MEGIEHEFTELFEAEPLQASPALDAVGLGLAVANLAHDGERLSFDALLAYDLPSSLLAAYRWPERAMICVLEEAGGRAAVFSASDPHVRRSGEGEANFLGPPAGRPGGPAGGTAGGWVGIPLRVSAPLPPQGGPSLYLTVLLGGYQSNTVAIDVASLSAVSYLRGKPSPVRTVEAEQADIAAAPPIVDEGGGQPEPGDDGALPAEPQPPPAPPPSGSPAFQLAVRAGGAPALHGPVLLDGKLSLTEEEFAPLGPEGWLRAALVCVMPEAGGVAQLESLTGDRVVLSDEGTPGAGGRGRVFTFALDLEQLLGGHLGPGRWFVQLSARHHRSAVLELVRG